ncbi:hypothetical protein [Neobacillus sp. DY30]|uniref:hypothetical protein n=1 Tax=Neobacillus sp. DY30 TaxID=3047871 RepID=UPI0024BF141A|nr:hypothetical protein [Neobacillus sp. DY30]WHX98455.1 hypothetical protein QNH29_17555 [Neobacillus sp. DY30]
MNYEQQKKDLILTTMVKYEWETVKPFFKSLERTGFSGEVVIFFNQVDKNTRRAIKMLNIYVTLIPFSQKGLESIFYIADYRYYLFNNFLKKYGYRYNNVLLSDVRDVIFQIDPFKANWKSDSITVAKEAKLLKENLWNTRWVLSKFGNYIYNQLQNEPIICAGTTYGPTNQILHYFNQMIHYLFYTDYVLNTDQAVHTYIVHTGKINPVTFSDNHHGPIMTLELENESDIKINENKQILLKNGDIAPIVHQFDRYPHLTNLVKALYN